MEKDIVPELYEQILADIKSSLEKDKNIREAYRLIADGKADYKTANEFSERVGEIYSKALKNNLNSGVLPDGKMYYNIAERTVRPVLEDCYGTVADATVQIQEAINEAAEIGIKGIKPTINDDRIKGIVNKLTNAESFDNTAWLLGEPVINLAQSAVADTVRVNAEFQSKAGLAPKIVRTTSGKCCKWCSNLAGTYSYPDDVPDDVYHRHRYCYCQVHYYPGNGLKRNVHTKKWVAPNEKELIKDRKTIGKKTLLPRANEAIIPREKFTEYALNPQKQPDKAKAFELALGYNTNNVDDLMKNIKAGLNHFPATEKSDNGFGKRYEVLMKIVGPNGKSANVLTAWIADNANGEMRLTSAYVKG